MQFQKISILDPEKGLKFPGGLGGGGGWEDSVVHLHVKGM